MSPYEITTIIISLLAFILSVYAAVNTYYEKHIKTKIHLRWAYYAGGQLNISLLISNMSARPSVLEQVFLNYNDHVVPSALHHARLTVEQNASNENISWCDITPINIPARSATNVILSFQYLDDFKLENSVNLTYLLNGIKLNRTEEIKHKFTTKEYVIALEYRQKHNM